MTLPGTRERPGRKQLVLPQGVSEADWASERARTQNPCIRAVLACVRRLEQLDSLNYFILRCSPEQLVQLREKLDGIVTLFEVEGLPRLREPSSIPALGRARRRAERAYSQLRAGDLARLDREPIERSGAGPEARRALSRTIGKLERYLEDTYGRLMAADPRSRHGEGYFLSKQFARHVRDTETLYGLVFDLDAFLEEQGQSVTRSVSALAETLMRGESPPVRTAWTPVVQFLRSVREDLAPRLAALVVMQGIRFQEARILDDLGLRLRVLAEVVLEQQVNLSEVEFRELRADGAGDSQASSRLVLSQRLARNLRDLDTEYRKLREFVPSWLTNLEARRALMLREIEPDV
ncbi:MAG: hypothetical protein R2991_09845 [Thermoanaerobaculia bacterium]